MQKPEHMKISGEFSLVQRLLIVVCGAFLVGSLWRMRGESGYGGMWGMFSVGVGMSLLLFWLFPGRQKMSYAMFPVMAVFAGLTVNGWGTLNQQMGGYIDSSVPFLGETAKRVYEISPWSGLAIMLALGFGWLSLFAFLTGCALSDKEHKFRHVVIIALLFFGVSYLCRATIAHPVLRLISPEAVEYFKQSLADQGSAASPYATYMQHFSNDNWAAKTPFARNYFTSVSVISSVFSAAAIMLYARFIMKDKTAARIALAVNSIMALAITIPDIFLIADSDRSPVQLPALAAWMQARGAWSFWEYGTGFFLGLGVFALAAFYPRKKLAASNAVPAMIPPLGGGLGYAYHLLLTLIAAFGALTVRPFLGKQTGDGAPGEIYSYIAAGVYAVAFIIIFALVLRKNVLKDKLKQPLKLEDNQFFSIALLAFYLINQAIYGFAGKAGDRNYLQVPLRTMDLLMIFSLPIVLLSFGMVVLLQKKKQNKLT